MKVFVFNHLILYLKCHHQIFSKRQIHLTFIITGHKPVKIRAKLDDIQGKPDQHLFARPHKSVIINICYVEIFIIKAFIYPNIWRFIPKPLTTIVKRYILKMQGDVYIFKIIYLRYHAKFLSKFSVEFYSKLFTMHIIGVWFL